MVEQILKSFVVSAAVACGVAANAFADFASDYRQGTSIVVEGNGAQNIRPYIDTGFKPNNNTRVVMSVDVQGTLEYWFGCWDWAYNNGAFAVGNDKTNVYTGWDGQGGGEGSVISAGVHTIDLNCGMLYVDGTQRRAFNPATFQVGQPLYLFLQNRSGSPSYTDASASQGVICYSCLIYDNEVLVRNFVPCIRKADNVPGMYDLVYDEAGDAYGSKGFYPNDGTGEFRVTTSGLPIRAEAGGYEGVADGEEHGISVNVMVPSLGTGCSYLWSADGGQTWSEVEPKFTTAGTYEVTCRISAEGYETADVSASVILHVMDDHWTYDANAKTITDSVWVLSVSEVDNELTVNGPARGSASYPGIELDLAKPVDGDRIIVAIGNNAFNKNAQIGRLVLPNTLRSVGEAAFLLCTALETVEPLLPPTVTTIGHYAFSGCLALKGDLSIGSVGGVPTAWKIPGSSSGTSQFDNCPRITSVVLHSATNVPGWCFQHDAAVTNVVFEGELASIGNSAFFECTGLKVVTPFLPPSVTEVLQGAFQKCLSLGGDLVVGRPGGPTVQMASDTANEPNHFAETKVASAVFHSVRLIPNECFHYCTSLTNVVLCDGIDRIGRFAFAGCTALTTVTPFLPRSVRHVGGDAFWQCNNLNGDLVVGQLNKPLEWDSPGDPNRQWADHQFAEIFGLKSATIYGDIDEIMANCFVMDSALETVRLYSKTPIDIRKEAFAGWNGHTPPIRDLYINAFATFGENAFRYHSDYTMRLWVARGNAQWDAWIAENVTPWNELGDLTNNYYTAFGAGARKPVGLVKDGVQPARQWVMRWSPGVGTMVLVR